MITIQELNGQQLLNILIILFMMICFLSILAGYLICTLIKQYKHKNKKRIRLVKGKLILKDGRVVGIEKDEDGLPRIVVTAPDVEVVKETAKEIQKQTSTKPIIDQLNEVYGKPYKDKEDEEE